MRRSRWKLQTARCCWDAVTWISAHSSFLGEPAHEGDCIAASMINCITVPMRNTSDYVMSCQWQTQIVTLQVVDMFGCGLPVCAASYQCIGELVSHGHNGLLFTCAEELARHLADVLKGFPGKPSQLLQVKFPGFEYKL